MSDNQTRIVELELAPNGTGRITVDGVDWSHRVSKVELVADAGGATIVTLTLAPNQVRVRATVIPDALVIESDGEVSG